jgi:monoamine oxidase
VLPVGRTEAQRRMPLGSVIKVSAVYERPFWRDAGLSGSVLDLDGPFHHCLDGSSPDAEVGVLVSFLAADAAREMSDAALGAGASGLRRARFLERAESWFGAAAAEPLHYRDLDWSAVPTVGGGYSGVMAPGAWAEAGPGLTAPVGCLHWAGSETASAWTGYVEGAVSSGRRAAAEILELRR